MGESSDLLFFDTFSHESSEELNLDLVQFPKPVYVSEVRIIPLGARVQGDFPGGVRLGATNPTQFHIDFFVNDLSKPGASTFEVLGSLEYCQNGRIHMECGAGEQIKPIPTDGLVLRGWYSTITLAVYGTITDNITEQGGTVAGAREVATPPESSTWTQLGPYPSNNYPPEEYQPVYQPDYYNRDAPKDPRAYHHVPEAEQHWERRDEKERLEPSRERDLPRGRDKERVRHGSSGRDSGRRSRSLERLRPRDLKSPRYSRSRSREREYTSRSTARDDGYRRDDSRSPNYRERDKDWSYKRDDYRRHRQSSYERGDSYERRAPSYEKRDSPYEQRPPSYENRAPSYEKRYDKRATSYDRLQDSYDTHSRSPIREDPRKRPRTPPMELLRRPHTPEELASHDDNRLSPESANSIVSDEMMSDYGPKGHKGKDGHKGYKHHKGDGDKHINKSVGYSERRTSIEGPPSPCHKGSPLDSPGHQGQEDNLSMEVEQFEPILSDEDICDDLDAPFGDLDYDGSDYCNVDDILKCYNPFRTEWQKYYDTNKPSVFLSNDENKKSVMSFSLKELCGLNTDFQKYVEIIEEYKKAEEKFLPANFANLSTDLKEEWVHVCEQLLLLIINISSETDILLRVFCEEKPKISQDISFHNVLSFTLNFCRVGLNYDLALLQTQATYKIRHIKCGIRLIEALTTHKHSGEVVMSLFNNNIDIFSLLFDLYSKDYMALSIKLMILKALDACLSSEEAVEYFLSNKFYHPVTNKDTLENKPKMNGHGHQKELLKNGYQILILLLNDNPLSRVKFAINSLINKMNLYELLKNLRLSALNLNKRTEKFTTGVQEITESEIELIINSFEEVLSIFRTGSFELSQPKRFLPVSAQFEINKSSMNNVLIEFFQIHKLLETCLFFLTCPLTYNYPIISNPIYEIMSLLTNCHEGLNYLADNIKTSELLFKCFMQPYSQQSDEDQSIILQDGGNCTAIQQLGLEMAYKLQAIYYVKALFDIQSESEDKSAEIVEKLHALYCLGFGSIGKLALAKVLSMGDNIQCLLNIYEKDIHIKQSDKDNLKLNKVKLPAKNYAVDLTVSTIQLSTDVNFLKKYGRRILNIAKKYDMFEQSIATSLQEVLPYLKPLEKAQIFSYDNINELVDVLKASIEHTTSAPGELITCIRILKHMGIPDYEHKKMLLNDMPRMEYFELKYKYIILQLFSLDGVSLLVSILEKLCSYYEQPSIHTATFVSTHGLHIVSMVLPSLELIHKMLTYVIQCRNTKFKDLTAIPVILQTFNLMHMFPSTCAGYRMAQKACKEAIDILLAYTQPIAEDATENELIHKSLWTLLCSEIIKYTLTAPYTFIPGLLILSELLPLPLPIQTKFALNESELSNMISNRKLWSGHLHTLSSNITEMIQTVCISACQPVVQLLKRVCIQLSDLAANTALCVTRSLLDLLVTYVCQENNIIPQPFPAITFNIVRLLNFISCLMTHPSAKCSMLHLMRQNSTAVKSEERHSLVMPILSAILTNFNENPLHIQSQECVVSIFNSLCDSEITLLTHFNDTNNTPIKTESPPEEQSEKQTMTSEIYLANALPSKEVIMSIVNTILDYLSNENSLLSVISSIMRTFFLLSEHDYGFYYLKTCLDKNKQVLNQLISKLVNGLGKDSPEYVTTFLELLKILQNIPEEADGTESFSPRSTVLTVQDIAEMVGWNNKPESQTVHPIVELEKFLKESNEEELLVHVQNLLSQLQSVVVAAETTVPPPPPVLPLPEPLVVQFSGRAMCMQGDAQDERLGSSYWLGVQLNQHEEEHFESEMVQCDLSEISRLYLPAGTDVANEAERLLHLAPAPPRPVQDSQTLYRTKRLHVPRDKRLYVSPAQSRPGGAAPPSSSLPPPGPPQGATIRPPMDAFRSRPPNTSRPPSLHVDDFLALEGCGGTPTGPTGYNKLPVMSARGRGMRGRGIMSDRGRFASAPAPTNSMYANNRRGRGAWGVGVGAPVGGPDDGSGQQHFGRNMPQHFQPPIMPHGANQYGNGWSRGARGARGLRHGRPSFMR